MKCPKCDLVTSNKRDLCPRCECDLRSRKRELGLPISNPSIPLAQLVAELRKEQGNSAKASSAAAPKQADQPELKKETRKAATSASGSQVEAAKPARRSLFSRLWSPKAIEEPARPASGPAPAPAEKKDRGAKSDPAPRPQQLVAQAESVAAPEAPASAIMGGAVEPAPAAPGPQLSLADDLDGFGFTVPLPASAISRGPAAPEPEAESTESEFDDTSFDWIEPGTNAAFVRSEGSAVLSKQPSEEFHLSAFTEIGGSSSSAASAAGDGMQQVETHSPFAAGTIDTELDDLLAELEAEQRSAEDDALFPDLKREKGEFDDILRELEGDAAPELDEMSLLEEPLAAITEVVREATSFTEDIRNYPFEAETPPLFDSAPLAPDEGEPPHERPQLQPEAELAPPHHGEARPDVESPQEPEAQPEPDLEQLLAELPQINEEQHAAPAAGPESMIEDDELAFDPANYPVHVATPTVTPEVMEFGEDDALLEQQLDAMLGDETLDIEAVPVPVSKAQRASTSKTLHVDDDLEISFELEVEDDELDDSEMSDDEAPSEPAHAAPVASNAGEPEDPMMRQLLNSFEAASRGAMKLEAAPQSPAALPEPAVVRSAEELRRAQSVLSKLPSLEDGVADELVKLLADAYGVHPATLKPRPSGPISDDVLLSLQSELDEELRALAEEGTTFLKTEVSENAEPEPTVQTEEAVQLTADEPMPAGSDDLISADSLPESAEVEIELHEPVTDSALSELEALQAELGAEIEALEREGCSFHREASTEETIESPLHTDIEELPAIADLGAEPARAEDAELEALSGELDQEYKELLAESAARMPQASLDTEIDAVDSIEIDLSDTGEEPLESALTEAHNKGTYSEELRSDGVAGLDELDSLDADLAALSAELDTEYALLQSESEARLESSDEDLSADVPEEMLDAAQGDATPDFEPAEREATPVAPVADESFDLPEDLAALTAELDTEYALLRSESGAPVSNEALDSEEISPAEPDLTAELALLADTQAGFGETTERSVDEIPVETEAAPGSAETFELTPELEALTAELDTEYALLRSESDEISAEDEEAIEVETESGEPDLTEELSLLADTEAAFGETTERSVDEVPAEPIDMFAERGLEPTDLEPAYPASVPETSATDVAMLDGEASESAIPDTQFEFPDESTMLSSAEASFGGTIEHSVTEATEDEFVFAEEGSTEAGSDEILNASAPEGIDELFDEAQLDVLADLSSLPVQSFSSDVEVPADAKAEPSSTDDGQWAEESPEQESELRWGVESAEGEIASSPESNDFAADGISAFADRPAIPHPVCSQEDAASVAGFTDYGRFRPPICDLLGTALTRLHDAYPLPAPVTEGTVEGIEVFEPAEADDANMVEAEATIVESASSALPLYEPSATGSFFAEDFERLVASEPPAMEPTSGAAEEESAAADADPLTSTESFLAHDLAAAYINGEASIDEDEAPQPESGEALPAEEQSAPSAPDTSEVPSAEAAPEAHEESQSELLESASATGAFFADDLMRALHAEGHPASAPASETVVAADADSVLESAPPSPEPLEEATATGAFLAQDIARVADEAEPAAAEAAESEDAEDAPFDDPLTLTVVPNANDDTGDEHPFEERAGVFAGFSEDEEVDLGTIADAFTGGDDSAASISVRATRVNTSARMAAHSDANEPIESAVSTGVFLATDLQRIVAEQPAQSRAQAPLAPSRPIEIAAELWQNAERDLIAAADLDGEFEISAMEIGTLEKGAEIALLFEVADDELRDPERARRHSEEIPVSHKKKVDTGKLDAALDRFSKEQKNVSTKVQAIRAQKVQQRKAQIEQLLAPASMFRRGMAIVLDTVIVLTLTFILCFSTSMPNEIKEAVASMSHPDYVSVLFYMPTFLFDALLLWVGSTALGVAMWGTTMGGRLTGLEVVSSVGEIPGLFQSITRACAQVTTLLTLGTGLLPLLGKKKRTLHDRLSRTYVRRVQLPVFEEE